MNKQVPDKENKLQEKTVIAGEVLSRGLARGKAFIYRDVLSRDIFFYDVEDEDIKTEWKRIREALVRIRKELHETKQVVTKTVNKANADIFEAQKAMLKDEILIAELKEELNRERVNAEQVVRNVFRRWAHRFKASENELVQAKAEDMDDLSRRIIRELLGYERNQLEQLPFNSIIVAKRLLPSDTVHLNKKNVKGVIVEEGGYNSHSAILARSLGVPAVCCPHKLVSRIKRGSILFIDGENNQIIVNPGQDEQRVFEEKVKAFRKYKSVLLRKTGQPAVTQDGTKILVSANTANEEDFKEAVRNGCDNIGLFRVEGLYLEHKTAPSVEYLTKQLESILKRAAGKLVVLRLLDVGGDKQLTYINVENERNPFLGLRGIRLLLKHPKILKTQIRVVLSMLDRYDVAFLVPMVTLPKEVKAVREMINEVKKESGNGKDVKIGTMVETPAAIVHIDEIAEISDFLSIGTNDLIQYTMAVGRENMSMLEYYPEGVETIMKMIKVVIDAAQKHSIPCSVCGEMAGDEEHVGPLLKMGIKELSVSPNRIPFIKEKIRGIRLK